MNFYQAQEQARKQTHRLLAFFSLAVIALVFFTSLCVAWFIWYSDPGNYASNASFKSSGLIDLVFELFKRLGWVKFFWVAALVVGTLLIAMAFKWSDLKKGGYVIAESLGGRLVHRDSDSYFERRLLNVVEEMAIASNIPVPPVYVLDNQPGINAFAAGLSVDDAVIGVTEGTLQYLDREKLQGVIAHEFSHILNGDMTLNQKIIVVVHGIMMIAEAGKLFMDFNRRSSFRATRRHNDGAAVGALFILGLCLFVLGWLGQAMGKLIRAGVSRQREFLADASAVQFTRNPEGIGGALKLIAGHAQHAHISHRKTETLGHLFFSSATSNWFSLLATHPPIDKRIAAVLPSWDGDYIESLRLREPVEVAESNVTTSDEPGPIEFVSGLLSGEGAESSLASVKRDWPSPEIKSTPKPTKDAVAVPADLPVKRSVASARPTEEAQKMEHVATDFSPVFHTLREKTHYPFEASAIVIALLMDHDHDARQKQLAILRRSGSVIWGDETFKKLSWQRQTESLIEDVQTLPIEQLLPLAELCMPSIKELSGAQYLRFKSLMGELIRSDGKVALLEWSVFELIRRSGDRYFGSSKPVKLKYRSIKELKAVCEIIYSRLIYELSVEKDELQRLMLAEAILVGQLPALNFLPREQCGNSRFFAAVNELSKAYPLLKPRVLKGMIRLCELSDIPREPCSFRLTQNLINVISVVIDCPLNAWTRADLETLEPGP